MMMTMMLF